VYVDSYNLWDLRYSIFSIIFDKGGGNEMSRLWNETSNKKNERWKSDKEVSNLPSGTSDMGYLYEEDQCPRCGTEVRAEGSTLSLLWRNKLLVLLDIAWR